MHQGAIGGEIREDADEDGPILSDPSCRPSVVTNEGGNELKFGILVNEGPFQHQASDTAYLFTKAALEKGHEVYRVFFYYDGVNNANKLSEPQADDRDLVKLWSKLAEQYKLDLVVCVAAALRRGIKNDILAPGFRISGLGQLIEAGIQADRLVTFGD